VEDFGILKLIAQETKPFCVQAEAEHAALVAVAEAAGAFAPYANAESSAPNGKEFHLAQLQIALDSLAAVRAGSESGIGTLNAKQQGEALLKSCPWTESLMKLPYAGSEVAK